MRRLLPALAVAAACCLLGGVEAFAQAQAPPAAWSAKDCLTCHEKAGNPAFAHSTHATLVESCASCHTNVAAHAKAQMAGEQGGPVPSMKKLAARDLNAVCLTCHEKDQQANWMSSMHDRRNVACTSCHSVHQFKSAKAQLKTAQDFETCVTCHKAERAKMMRTSHHPVREGKLNCSSCHNPHDGAEPKMLRADSVNELCYSCHTEKRGPFLFEHAPVREDCATCHDPHGSSYARMLTQRAPNLCRNCHLTGSGHFGSSNDNLTTEQGVPVAPAGALAGYPVLQSRFIERSCRNCHVAIHGSNHPSGAFLVR